MKFFHSLLLLAVLLVTVSSLELGSHRQHRRHVRHLRRTSQEDDDDSGSGGMDADTQKSMQGNSKGSVPVAKSHGGSSHDASHHSSSGGESSSSGGNLVHQTDASTPDGPKKEDGVTAALISWKRTQNIEKILKNLARYKWIKEVVLWNNNKNITLSPHEHWPNLGDVHYKIIVHEDGKNLNNEARYHACRVGSYDACYFQDDDFEPTVLDGLYASYKGNPHLVHLITTPGMRHRYMKWSYFNSDIKMHSSFAFIGVASIVPKKVASKFIDQLSETNINKKYRFCADVMFTIWTNEIPVILTATDTGVKEIATGQKEVAYSEKDPVGYASCRIYGQIEATKLMEEFLKKKQQTVFSTEFHSSNYQKRVFKGVSKTGDFIVTSNIKLSGYTWNDEEKFTQSKAEEILSGYYSELRTAEPRAQAPEINKSWKHDWSNMVDHDVKTDWQMFGKEMKKGDWFGLYGVEGALGKKKLKVYGSEGIQGLTLEKSDDGRSWKNAGIKPTEGMEGELHTLEYIPSGDGITGRWVRLSAQRDLPSLKIAEIKAG